MLSAMRPSITLPTLDDCARLMRGRGDRLVLPGWSALLVLANAGPWA